jgi:hypothetical protein
VFNVANIVESRSAPATHYGSFTTSKITTRLTRDQSSRPSRLVGAGRWPNCSSISAARGLVDGQANCGQGNDSTIASSDYPTSALTCTGELLHDSPSSERDVSHILLRGGNKTASVSEMPTHVDGFVTFGWGWDSLNLCENDHARRADY